MQDKQKMKDRNAKMEYLLKLYDEGETPVCYTRQIGSYWEGHGHLLPVSYRSSWVIDQCLQQIVIYLYMVFIVEGKEITSTEN